MEELKPTKGIVIYSSSSETYAEVHDIVDGEFSAGRPLKKKELLAFQNIGVAKKDEHKIKECFPNRIILGFSSSMIDDYVTWIFPACKIELKYSKKVSGLKTDEYHIPNIVFKSNGKTVSVFAIKEKDILHHDLKTDLYHAPFMNVNSSGGVCMGSAKIKKYHNLTQMIKSVEDSFFLSVFTHTNHNNIVEGGLLDAYNNQKRKFDENILIPCQKLGKLLKNE